MFVKVNRMNLDLMKKFLHYSNYIPNFILIYLLILDYKKAKPFSLSVSQLRPVTCRTPYYSVIQFFPTDI